MGRGYTQINTDKEMIHLRKACLPTGRQEVQEEYKIQCSVMYIFS